MPHLRPPIPVHVPEEWGWNDYPHSRYHPIHRLATMLEAGADAADYTITACASPDLAQQAVYINSTRHALRPAPRNRILISPGPWFPDEAFLATDRETYDGAEDSKLQSHIGKGDTPRTAALNLLAIAIEHDYYDADTCTALCAEIARRWL